MRRITTLAPALAAALAFGALAATAALAAKGPAFAYCSYVGSGGKWLDSNCTKLAEHHSEGAYEDLPLGKGETLTPLARAATSQTLTWNFGDVGIPIECKGLSLKPGAALIGGTPGTDTETIEYRECGITTSGLTSCKINNEAAGSAHITTKPLSSTLVYLTKTAAELLESDETGTLLSPTTGKDFAEFTIGPEEAGCTIEGEVKLKNEVIVSNGPNAGSEELLHLLNAPATAIGEYFNAAGELTKIKTLEAGGFAASYQGLVSLLADELDGPRVAWWVL